MCGLAGSLFIGEVHSDAIRRLEAMLATIAHRGPDDQGLWQEQRIALGHRRLSILDLSPAGHQPMVSHCGRYVIAFNGEIYNFQQLRQDVEAVVATSWRGHSDTEVLLSAVALWGVQNVVGMLNGMFAFALWDKQEQTLWLARDPFGEKPLYVLKQDAAVHFASEVRCFEVLPEAQLTIDQHAVSELLQHGYINAPHSIYKEVNKVLPGTLVQIDSEGRRKDFRYWDAVAVAELAKTQQFTDPKQAIFELETALKQAVKLRMMADVPLGALLSGGIDSSLVVALMQAQSSAPVNTFSIGFHDSAYNEAHYAKAVAEHLGTNHHEWYLSDTDVLEAIPRLGGLFDEPFADSSQLPTYLVSQLAKTKVTVCLTGDGGDELFSGYRRYAATGAIWKKISKVPCRNLIAKALKSFSPEMLEKLFFFLKPYADKYSRQGALGPKIHRFADWIRAQSVDDLYIKSMTLWNSPSVLAAPDTWFAAEDAGSLSGFDEIERMMLRDTQHYLPGDILAKVDRAAMAVSLEGRIPLLDPAIYRLAWQMPIQMRRKDGQGKWPLRQLLHKYVPTSLFERPKLGFGVPVHSWLRNELKDWSHDLLSETSLAQHGLFNSSVVQQTLNNHELQKENSAAKLWTVLMFQSWYQARKS